MGSEYVPLDEPSLAQEQYLVAARRLRERGIAFGTNVMQMLCRIPEGVELAALGRALGTLIARHDALRYRFVPDGSRFFVTAAESPLPQWEVVDRPAGETDAQLMSRLQELARRSINELDWPLWRATVILGKPSYLAFTIHHIISDGVSVGVARTELESLYRAEVSGHPARLPDPGSFRRYCAQERAWFADPAEREEWLVRWRRLVGENRLIPPFPLDLRVDPGLGVGGETRTVLTGARLEELERRCLAGSATLFMGLVAAYSRAIGQVAEGCPEYGMLIALSNRIHRGYDRTIGWFSQATPCYLRIDHPDNFSEYLREAARGVGDALACWRLPLPYAMRFLDPVSYRGDGDAYPSCFLSLTDSTRDQAAPDGEWEWIPSLPIWSANHRLWFHRVAGARLEVNASAPRHPVFERIEAVMAETLHLWSVGG